jgi:pectin methylesterase-like acyl-CoA thioesterase/lysophospholipase L1-like esterase
MMIVAQDGSGQFKRIQDAIDSIPEQNNKRVTIFIKDGIYKEKLTINKPLVSLIGTHKEKVKITFADYAKKTLENGKPMGTFGSYSTIITGDGFLAKNITFENNAGSGDIVGQAVAVYVDADQVEFHYCSFLGRQDTLFTAPLPPKPIEGDRFGGPREGLKKRLERSYFNNCYLEGDVDFIFGSAKTVFEQCTIHSLDKFQPINGYITAASTPMDQPYGYVFKDCFLTSDAPAQTVYLGRPWRDYARTVFINSWMGKHIREEGWHNWDKVHAEKTTYYAEYNSQGPGGSMEKRVPWAKVLTDEQAKQYTIATILGVDQGWPTLGVQEAASTRIYLAGDSTVEDVSPGQGIKKGWGQQIRPYFMKDVQFINKARGGRSTKSFIHEGLLQEILSEIKANDFLFIQFGHNDQKIEDETRGTDPYSTYQEYLTHYITGARDKGAIPILLTPVNRRTFDEQGKLVNSLDEYPEAMRQLAASMQVPLIDLWEKSMKLYEELGPEETKKFFSWYETKNPDTTVDDTHFSAYGATRIAELVIEGIQEIGLPINDCLIGNVVKIHSKGGV